MNTQEMLKMLAREVMEEEILSVDRGGGLTNLTYFVTLDSGKFVFRLPGEGTEELINRKNEKISTELACSLGIDAELKYFHPQTGVKISAYIDGAETMSAEKLREPERIVKAAALFKRLHTCGKDTEVAFEVFGMAEGYEKIIQKNGIPLFKDYREIRGRVQEIRNRVKSGVLVPCHNDSLCENWVEDKNGRMYLVDWEYAGMNDPMWDLADLSIEAEYGEAEDGLLLKAYFGREADQREWERFVGNKIFLDFLWSLWGKTRVPFSGKAMEAYAGARYERLKRNMKRLEGK